MPHRPWACMKTLIGKAGNFHRGLHPNTPKEHGTCPQAMVASLCFLKDGISWLVWFALRPPCCPVGRVLLSQHWLSQGGTTAGVKSAVIPAVGLQRNEKALPPSTYKMGAVRIE